MEDDSWRKGKRPEDDANGQNSRKYYGPRGRGRGRRGGDERGRGGGGRSWRQHDVTSRGAASTNDLSFDQQDDRDGMTKKWRGRGRGDGRYTKQRWNENSRGANSMNDLSQGPQSSRDGRSKKWVREHPIGYKELERLSAEPCDVVAMELVCDKSGYNVLLQQQNIPADKIFLTVKLLAHACGTKSNKEALHQLLLMTFEQRFIDSLCSFSMEIKRLYPDKATKFFNDLHLFLQTFTQIMPSNAIERIANLVDACKSVLEIMQMKAFVSSKLVTKYEDLENMLTEKKKSWEPAKREKKTYGFDDMDNDLEPPENFKDLPVLPIPQDFSHYRQNFLRKNVVQGKYKDGEHYLDVQFRLLREDFVRPLRNGINDFKDGKSKNRDVRVYRGVKLLGCDIKRQQMIHLVKLNLPKHFKVENSKKLLYGNLLCFSNDNFRTMILGSVAERDKDMMQEGILGVQFESDVKNLDLTKTYVMMESRAYFMAYKHILKALQEMSGKEVPMSDHVVHVNSTIDPPHYLRPDHGYDLRVLKHSTMMKASESTSLFRKKDNSLIEDDGSNDHLRQIRVLYPIECWPSANTLGLDDSQLRALHGALTRRLAIIQGPPGTGKTFIGLKLAQILLHNSEVWKDANNPKPILVVCFTNHALDQFLEGMTSFTKSIVRVGSRCNNEEIQKFQINLLARGLRDNRRIPQTIYGRNLSIMEDLRYLEFKVRQLRAVADACNSPLGILSLEILTNDDIIPPNIRRQLEERGGELTDWLLVNAEYDYVGQNNVEQPLNTQDITNEESDDDEMFHDAEELLKLEEEDRMLDETEDEADTLIGYIHVRYEVTYESLDEEINQLTDIANDPRQYFQYTVFASQKRALEIGLNLPVSKEEMSEFEKTNFFIWQLDFPTRWKLYKYWLIKLHKKAMQTLTSLEANFKSKLKARREVQDQEYLHIMRNHAIVGMTTTGAAQYNSLMQDLAPSIVIIEEAAEILESHVITSMTANCQHLILIGDHQQLRPSTTVYELATKYGLETSLFERMIKNGLTYESLEYQHRMRPCISRLLVPAIYPSLKDHPSVHQYPGVRGVARNLFFITHTTYEKQGSDDNNSHENQHEAELLIGLCRHLLLNGDYTPEDITVITPYSGQFFLLRKLQRNHAILQGVRICVVDNFQGEENKVILLSLVRSNEEEKVGFLKTENRVCVALSRAKHALYITGNMDQLSASSSLWQKIRIDLEKDGNIGQALPIVCENHPEVKQFITQGKEFYTKSPEGGCQRVCNYPLPSCGHSCPMICHFKDRDHRKYTCLEPCPKVLCELDHKCPKRCWQECGPCEVKIAKDIPCGHKHRVPCHVPPKEFQCPTLVTKVIPSCQHEAQMPCHKNPKSFECPEDCDTRLDCGHQCRLKCHVKNDPEHSEYRCLQECTRLNEGCSQDHPCQKLCYEKCGDCVMPVQKRLPCGHTAQNVLCHAAPESVECRQKCKKTLACGHPCKELCYKPCKKCPVKVKKVVPDCQHTVIVECWETPSTQQCSGACPKVLPCGHPCREQCRAPCTPRCLEKVPVAVTCPRGHQLNAECHRKHSASAEELMLSCEGPCGQTLVCGHACEGSCGQCFQGRVHVACRKPCLKPLVCGHICKSPCSENCPPCREMCEWRCVHSRCKKFCGTPCEPCKEKCKWRCEHHKCEKRCGEVCSRPACAEPCGNTLDCGHPCIGFCGDPCPPLCRTCDAEDLTDFTLLGFEEDEDARFVWLPDCGHCIEAEGLDGWLRQDSGQIGMKTCPRCRHPIYNSVRYKDVVVATYEDVKKVKEKYYTSLPKTKARDIDIMLADPTMGDYFMKEVTQVSKALGLGQNQHKQNRRKMFNESELRLYNFQALVLKRATKVLTVCFKRTGQPKEHMARLRPLVEELVRRVMQQQQVITPQMVDEVGYELQRLALMPPYWTLKAHTAAAASELHQIVVKIDAIMNPLMKFGTEEEKRVRLLLKESESYVGGLGISDSERIMILQAMGLKQGHWYKCPRGHVYCIGDCGGATNEGKCPECGLAIGGANHRLRSDNALATEMDGAARSAWPTGLH